MKIVSHQNESLGEQTQTVCICPEYIAFAATEDKQVTGERIFIK